MKKVKVCCFSVPETKSAPIQSVRSQKSADRYEHNSHGAHHTKERCPGGPHAANMYADVKKERKQIKCLHAGKKIGIGSGRIGGAGKNGRSEDAARNARAIKQCAYNKAKPTSRLSRDETRQDDLATTVSEPRPGVLFVSFRGSGRPSSEQALSLRTRRASSPLAPPRSVPSVLCSVRWPNQSFTSRRAYHRPLRARRRVNRGNKLRSSSRPLPLGATLDAAHE